jgi:hypothetical protein
MTTSGSISSLVKPGQYVGQLIEKWKEILVDNLVLS